MHIIIFFKKYMYFFYQLLFGSLIRCVDCSGVNTCQRIIPWDFGNMKILYIFGFRDCNSIESSGVLSSFGMISLKATLKGTVLEKG